MINYRSRIYKKAGLWVLCLVFAVSLAAPIVAALEPNKISNPSVEVANATNPASPKAWRSNGWGNNTRAFSYDSGATNFGTRSLGVKISGYVSGDAKWIFNPVPIRASQSYAFSDNYRSNVQTKYTAAYVLSNGSTKYVDLAVVPARSTWTKKTIVFTSPANVVSVSVYHILNRNGWLNTDNYALSETITASDPTISFSAPSPDATVSGTSSISALATNSIGVTFALDGVALGPEDTSLPYVFSWDTTKTTNAVHTLSATARSSNGKSAVASLSVTVNNPETPPSVNLFGNPSAETNSPDPTLPAAWNRSSWGNNIANFTYPVSGRDSMKAVRTDVRNYVDGDAKWMPTPVAVSPSTAYALGDYSRSNVTTRLVGVMANSAGTVKYVEIGIVTASPSWQKNSFVLTTESNTVSLTIYHLLSGDGWLEQDDVYLEKVVGTGSNPITNHSLELQNGTSPYAWRASRWGTNTAMFEYVSDAHSGSKAAKVTVEGYVDGDAKWLFEPITTLAPNKQYRWSTWYKTNTEPKAALLYERADGTTYYPSLPQPFPPSGSATTWTYFAETFTVPSDVVAVSAYFYVAQNGWLIVDDQSLSPYTPTGFNRPLVSLSFDDGSDSNLVNALPIMKSRGFHSTQCYETAALQANPDAGRENVMAFFANGDEVCSHTVTHPFLTKLTDPQLTKELTEAQTYLQNIISSPVKGFATPYGDYDPRVNTQIKRYYNWHRTVDEGYNSKDNLDRYRLRVQNLTRTTTLAEYQSWLDVAKRTNTWLILVYHDVDNDPSLYGSFKTDFQNQMAVLSASGITVKTVADALAEVSSQ